ncbi:MAG: GspH/FimT family pseudopilin [bacterium]|nr:GspH/FimT family pseudopilin [bacterium]
MIFNRRAYHLTDDTLSSSMNIAQEQSFNINPLARILFFTGFTLIELLITVSVFAILLTVAIPSFNTALLNNRLKTNTDSLVNVFNYARSVALNNNYSITVCPLGSNNSTTCGTNWTAGWIIITQPSTGSPTLLKSQQDPSINPKITANVSSVTFDSHGLAATQSNFTLCDSRGASYANSVTILASGFIQSGDTRGTAVWNNAALVCP